MSARVNAVLIDTCFVHGTLIVLHTVRFEALHAGVACPALGTVADGPVLVSATKRLAATGFLHQARVNTLLLDARLCHGTVGVHTTYGLLRLNFITVDMRVARVTRRTGALRTAVDDLALGAGGTRVDHSTRVQAQCVATHLRRTTLVVRRAAWRQRRAWSALDVSVASEAWHTLARHRPEGKGVDHVTLGIGATWVDHLARVAAPAVEAGHLAEALSICLALLVRRLFHRLANALDVSIAIISRRTGAERAVVDDAALGLWSTVTWVLALVIDAGQP